MPCCKESREDASRLIRVILHLVEIDAKFFAVSSFADRVVDNYFVVAGRQNTSEHKNLSFGRRVPLVKNIWLVHLINVCGAISVTFIGEESVPALDSIINDRAYFWFDF